jgi:hypothetical protein
MADGAFEVLLETGINISPLPVWLDEWEHPENYLWAYAPGAFEDLKAVVYDFCESRAGEHCRTFLGEWKGSLVCDDYAGYKAGFVSGITLFPAVDRP